MLKYSFPPSQKNIYYCFTDYTKAFVWITSNYQTTLPVSWETYMQDKKQQLVLGMEQPTGSKLGKEDVKSGYCHPAYLSKWWYLDLNTGLSDFRGLLFPTCKAGMWAQLTAFLHLLFTCKENRSDHEVYTECPLGPAARKYCTCAGRASSQDSVVRDPLEPIHWPLCVCVCVLFYF